MEGRRAPETDEELVEILADLFENTELEESEEEVEAALRELGYDPDELVARMGAVVQQAIENSPLNWRSRSQELEKERDRIAASASPKPTNREDMLEKIQRLLSTLGRSEMQLAYRNLDRASDDDLASLLAELEYLVASQSKQANDCEH